MARQLKKNPERSPKIRHFFQSNFPSLEAFKDAFIGGNRGVYLFLVRCQDISGIGLADFLSHLPDQISRANREKTFHFQYYVFGDERDLLIGLAPVNEDGLMIPSIDGGMGRYHDDLINSDLGKFSFGVGRTICNAISDVAEVFEELNQAAQKNLQDNLVRWSWTYYNRANDYFASKEEAAVIQPILHYDHHRETYSLKGGEVFVGGNTYKHYGMLMADIPRDQDANRVELLILEKLISSCRGAPGLLKFNLSPQTLIDTFSSPEKVERFHELIRIHGLNPMNIRIELIEKPYEETRATLKDVCRSFWQYGISFAADDFGVKSQSHQVVLELGEMIKEFKLDPISFKFKPEEDHTKFLDNLAFIDYCKRLADNRDAIITAEAVDDYDTLRFLIAHQVYHFQTNLFCRKMSIRSYTEGFHEMQNLEEEKVRYVLTSSDLLKKQKRIGNIFRMAGNLHQK